MGQVEHHSTGNGRVCGAQKGLLAVELGVVVTREDQTLAVVWLESGDQVGEGAFAEGCVGVEGVLRDIPVKRFHRFYDILRK